LAAKGSVVQKIEMYNTFVINKTLLRLTFKEPKLFTWKSYTSIPDLVAKGLAVPVILHIFSSE